MSLAQMTAAIEAQTSALAALAEQASKYGDIANTVQGASNSALDPNSFEALLGKIANFQAFGGIGVVGPGGQGDSGPISIGDLLQKLATLLETQHEFMTNPNVQSRTNPAQLDQAINAIVQLIQTWGGPAAATGFNLDKFKQFLASGGSAGAASAGGGGANFVTVTPASGGKPSQIIGTASGIVKILGFDQLGADLDAKRKASEEASKDLRKNVDVLRDSGSKQVNALQLMMKAFTGQVQKAVDDAVKKITGATAGVKTGLPGSGLKSVSMPDLNAMKSTGKIP